MPDVAFTRFPGFSHSLAISIPDKHRNLRIYYVQPGQIGLFTSLCLLKQMDNGDAIRPISLSPLMLSSTDLAAYCYQAGCTA